jgi:hypothetical protein
VFGPILESLGLSLHFSGPPGGEVNDVRVGFCRDCFGMSLLGGDVFSHEVDGLATPCTGLRLTTAHRGVRSYL